MISRMYQRLITFAEKKENKELLVHSLLGLSLRMVGAVGTFIMNVVVARYLGATQAGYFFLAITVCTIIVAIGRIGADQSVLRFVSIYSEKKEWDKVNGAINKMMQWSLITSVILTTIVCFFSKSISIHFFHKAQLEWPLFWIGLSIPLFASFNLFSMALQGLRKVILSVIISRGLPFLLIILALIFAPQDGATISILYFISSILTFITARYLWKRQVPFAKGNFDASVLWSNCAPLWIVAIMEQLQTWGGQFVAGIYNTPAELAQLAVARNMTVLLTFILNGVSYASAPRFASLYSEGKSQELKKYAQHTTHLMTLLALPTVLFIWFFPGFIMSLFGKEFTEGIWLLRILAIGQFINVITGSVSYLLSMSGHGKDLRNITIINGILAVVLAFILNPTFGAIGSAIATAIAIASSNLMAVGFVKKRLGFSTLSILGFK